MDSQYIENTRRQLETRIQYVMRWSPYHFWIACEHLLSWLDQHPLLSTFVAELGPKTQEFIVALRPWIERARRSGPGDAAAHAPLRTKNMAEQTALALAVLQSIRELQMNHTGIMQMLCLMLTGEHPEGGPRLVERLIQQGILLLRDYLWEQIDRRNITLYLIHKYRRRCEWFHADTLRRNAEQGIEEEKGELALQIDLFDYLHEQGMDFQLDPRSPVGFIDLLSEELALDVKYLPKRDSAKEKLKKGFRQVHRYCQKHNKPVGYLVAFKTCYVDIDVELESADGFWCFQHTGHTVYYVEIDLHHYSKSASALPKADMLTLKKTDIVQALEEPAI